MNKNRLIVLGWDDADTLDRKYVKLFDRLSLKCTFFINSENIDVLPNKFKSGEIAHVYAGHEAAGHTLMHPNLVQLPDDEVIRQVEQDRLNLQRLFGYRVEGFAYPGGSGIHFDKRVIELIRNKTGVKYARTGINTHSFDLPADFYEWNPTGHILLDDINALADEFFALKTDELKMLFIWGHSYELEFEGLYERFEKFCEKIAGHDDVEYASCGTAYDLITRSRGF